MNNFIKNSLIILFLISILLSLSVVSAEDTLMVNDYDLNEDLNLPNSNEDSLGIDSNDINQNNQDNEENNLDIGNEINNELNTSTRLGQSVEEKTFEDIQTAIDNSVAYSILELEGVYTSSGNPILINKTLTIIGTGEGATLDGKFISRIFDIEADNVTLQNLKIINSNFTETSQNKGAVYCNGNEISIINCTFMNNTGLEDKSQGAAIRWDGENGKLINSRFVNNSAYRAGAVFVNNVGILVSNTEFLNNHAFYQEGALFCGPKANRSVVNGCTFINNSAVELNGAYRACSNDNNITNCIFIGNSAGTQAGAILCCNAGNLFENCTFINNSANEGAGIFFRRTGNIVNKCVFIDNSASKGGAIYNNNLSTTHAGNLFENCTFINNSANEGASIFFKTTQNIVNRCVFINNSASNGAAIYNNQSDTNNTVNYSIFDGNKVNGNASAYYGEASNLIACFFGKNYDQSRPIFEDNLIHSGIGNQAPSSWVNLIGEDISYNKLNYLETYDLKFVLNTGEELNDTLPDYNVSLSNSNTNNQVSSEDILISNNTGQFTYLANEASDDIIKINNINNRALISQINVTFQKKTPSLTIEVPDVNKGETVIIHVNLTCGDEKLNDVNVSVQFPNGKGSDIKIFNGAGQWSYNNLEIGSYSITAIFNETEEYNSAEASTTFEVKDTDTPADENTSEKENLVILAFPQPNPVDYGENVTFYIRVLNVDLNDTAILSINGCEKIIYIADGQMDIILSNLNAGLNNITLIYKGNDKYYNKTVENILEVKKLSTNLAFKNMSTKSVDTKIDGRAGQYFSFTLKDKNGKNLANKDVLVKLNGVVYKLKTNNKGLAKLQINLKAVKTYAALISFAGDSIYEKVSATAKIVVKKQSFKLYTYNRSYKLNAKSKRLYVVLKSSKGKAVIGKKIVFRVNGKNYIAKTNSKGLAIVNVNLNKRNTYKFAVKFAGDKTVNAIVKYGKIRIY